MGTRTSRAVAARRAQPARRRPASLKKKIKTFFAFLTLAILSGIAVGSIYLILIVIQVSKTLPSLTEIGNFQPSEGTRIYYSDGTVMAILATENRTPRKLKDIDKKLIDATVATEDNRFYEHRGVDVRGIVRAVYRNVAGGEMRQGASTITQQLARNIQELGLTREKKFRRKVAEALLAVKIEQTFSKEEILEMYLNQIYYGNGAYGVEAAARTYFHKSAAKLSLGEASLLAGLPQSPSHFANNLDAARERRDWVLERMVITEKITPEERDKARAANLKIYEVQPNATKVFGSPYFVNYVVAQLVNTYGPDAVYSGWKIYTTLDSQMQKEAEKALRYGISRYGESANQGALISLDPKTGFIRAMVGGLDFKKNQYNIVTQGLRQPGSAFKPIVFTAGMDTGTCDLEKTYVDDPNLGIKTNNNWKPKNYGGKYTRGAMTVRTALRHSVNTIAVKAALDAGLNNVIDYAHRMGLTTDIPPYPPIALGAAAVHPIELCSAYSIFPAGGKRAVPMGIKRVVANNGDLIEEHSPTILDTGIKQNTIQMMDLALQEVVQKGTGTLAAAVPNARGKTGTTSDNRDAWFAGYTPELVTVIWVGHEQYDKKRRVKYLEMPGATGGHLCAPIWRDYMLKAVPVQQAYNRAVGGAGTALAEKTLDLDSQKPKPTEIKPPDANALQPPVSPDGVVGPPAETTPGTSGDAPPGATPENPVTTPHVTPPPATNGTPTTVLPPTTSGLTLQPVRSETHLPRTSRGGDPSTRFVEPTGRYTPPPIRRPDPNDEVVGVSLCAETGRRANRWCTPTLERRMARRDFPSTCRTHRAPPGEN